MSTGRPPSGTIPTLTEVVAWPDPDAAVEEVAATQIAPVAPALSPVVASPAPSPVATAPAISPVPVPPDKTRPATAPAADVQLTQRVLADLQRQVELMLEVRLREALVPILARASDALVRDARKELTAAMRDIVLRSIERELGRREDR